MTEYISMRLQELHSRRALENYRPCEECSPEYRACYAKLETLVESADMLFDRAYETHNELIAMAKIEQR